MSDDPELIAIAESLYAQSCQQEGRRTPPPIRMRVLIVEAETARAALDAYRAEQQIAVGGDPSKFDPPWAEVGEAVAIFNRGEQAGFERGVQAERDRLRNQIEEELADLELLEPVEQVRAERRAFIRTLDWLEATDGH